MSRFRLSNQAHEDLHEIWHYIGSDDPIAADRFVGTLVAKFEAIADQPGMGPARDKLAKSLRSFPVGNYVIFYRAIDEGVEIVRVLSGFRDMPALFPDE